MTKAMLYLLAALALFHTCNCQCDGQNDYCGLPQDVIQANRDSFCKLGLQSGFIPNHVMSASSYYGPATNDFHHFKYGRLDMPNQPGVHNGGWSAQNNAAGEYIQVDLFKSTKITGVITQGRNQVAQWVTRYKISYLAPFDTTWKTVKDSTGNNDAIFHGNSDQDTKVTNIFHEPIYAVKIRLVAQQWRGHISLRHEYLTC